MNPSLYGQLAFGKAMKDIKCRKDVLCNKHCWANCTFTCRRIKLCLSHTVYKNQFKMDKIFKHRLKTVKLLYENSENVTHCQCHNIVFVLKDIFKI